MEKRREGKPGGARAEEARGLQEARADEGRASVKLRSAVDTRLVIQTMNLLHTFNTSQSRVILIRNLRLWENGLVIIF